MKSKELKMTSNDLLLAAADVLYTGHFMKGEYSDGLGSFCTIGSMNRAYLIFDDNSSLLDKAISDVTKRVNLHGWDDIASWNDEPDRTKDEAIQTLHDTARGVK